MGLLGALGFGAELAGLCVLLAKFTGDGLPGGGQCICGKVYRIRPHVGNVSGLVQALGNAHGTAHAKAQFAGCFLLEGGGGKRCGGIALGGLCFNGAHRVPVGT